MGGRRGSNFWKPHAPYRSEYGFRTPMYSPHMEHRSFKKSSTNNVVDNVDYDAFTSIMPQGELDLSPETRHKMESTALYILNMAYMDARKIIEGYAPALLSLATTLKE